PSDRPLSDNLNEVFFIMRKRNRKHRKKGWTLYSENTGHRETYRLVIVWTSDEVRREDCHMV
ncbi:hypothetical protein J6590_067070, partial [Homalodisca vitripennis]